jgi:hypothetical protein
LLRFVRKSLTDPTWREHVNRRRHSFLWAHMKIIGWLLTRIFLPIIFLGMPIVAAVGCVKDTKTTASLNLQSHQVALLVGFGGGDQCSADGHCIEVTKRTFVIFPQFSIASVSESTKGIEIQSMQGGGILVVLIWVAAGWCTWWSWIRPWMTKS